MHEIASFLSGRSFVGWCVIPKAATLLRPHAHVHRDHDKTEQLRDCGCNQPDATNRVYGAIYRSGSSVNGTCFNAFGTQCVQLWQGPSDDDERSARPRSGRRFYE